ncbi:MAG: hypothetical protein IJT44_13360 [Clostridia bacterium]|nr:hypothetical protein [Clostridia bacterium]
MKRWLMLGAALLALAGILGGCGAKETAKPSDTAESTSVRFAVDEENETFPEDFFAAVDPTGTDAAAQAGTTKAGGSASDTTKAGETTASATTKAGETTASGTTKAGGTTASGTTKAGETTASGTAKAGETTMSGTTKAGETTTSGQTPGAPVTKKPATTKPVPTNPDTTKPDGTTATVPAAAKGNAVRGTIGYLKETKSGFVSKLTAEDLEDYGITGDKQKEVLAHPEQWHAYTVQIDFQNNETTPVTLYYLDVTENGKGDVFLNGTFSTEFGLAPGGTMGEQFYLLAKSSDVDGQVLTKVRSLAMRVQYAATPRDDDATPAFVYSKVG